MLRRYNGSSWQDIINLRRWNGSAWQDATLKRHDGSNWMEVWSPDLKLYNWGDECTSVTGGWGRVVPFWQDYTSGSGSYIAHNSETLDVKSKGWGGNYAVCTQNPVDLTNYNKLYIKFQVYGYTVSYLNQVQAGIVHTVPDYICYSNPAKMNSYSLTPSPNQVNYNVMYNGGSSVAGTWRWVSHNIDISTINRTGYIWICPTSWSAYDDYTIAKIYEVKLTK